MNSAVERALGRAGHFAALQDSDTELVDMLADVMHWATEHGEDFDYALRMARIHHDAEQAGEDE